MRCPFCHNADSRVIDSREADEGATTRRRRSCPACGRTEIDLTVAAAYIKEYCKGLKANIKVAVMGCIVNGPGEAKDADIGLAGGKGSAVIFKKGQVLRTVNESEMVAVFIEELRKAALNG